MPIVGPKPISSGRVLPAERLSEIAEILAVAVMRLRARKSSEMSGENGEFSLDISATQSSHPTRIEGGIVDG
jgi:hypothetical protein